MSRPHFGTRRLGKRRGGNSQRKGFQYIFSIYIFSQSEREKVVEKAVLPLDLELFSYGDWSEVKTRYIWEFGIYCRLELRQIASICEAFRTEHKLK